MVGALYSIACILRLIRLAREEASMDAPKGISHVSLSVRDLDVSNEWYQRVLGLKTMVPVFELEHYRETILTTGHVGLCLQQHFDNTGDEFSEHRTGLDHLSFSLESQEEYDAWLKHLDAEGVQYWEQSGSNFGPMVVFRDPDNVQLELHLSNR